LILVEIRYSSDAERKRAEYVLDRYSGRINIRKARGSVLFVSGEEGSVESMLRELYARLGPDKVRVYRVIEEEGPEPLRATIEARLRFSNTDEAWGAISAVMARLRGVLAGEIGGGREYRIHGRGGMVTVRALLRDGSGVRARFILEGFGPNVFRVRDQLLEELSYIGEVEG